MSATTIENDLVHYEVLGRGRPVILIHGWLGSWRYWIPSMQQLSAKYRAYALDLWGFGDSEKNPRRYALRSQVLLLGQFMDKLGIQQAALIGHDLGATVAVQYARWNPSRVPRLMTVCPPLFAMAGGRDTLAQTDESAPVDYTEAQTMVKPTEEITRWREQMKQQLAAGDNVSKTFQAAATPPTDQPVTEVGTGVQAPSSSSGSQSGGDQQENPIQDHLGTLDRVTLLERHVEAGANRDKLRAELDKADPIVIAESIKSFAGYNVLQAIQNLTVPNVALYGTKDTFIPPPTKPMLTVLGLSEGPCKPIDMDGARHFPMLENVSDFNRLLLDFLEVPDVTQLNIKKQWERRVR